MILPPTKEMGSFIPAGDFPSLSLFPPAARTDADGIHLSPLPLFSYCFFVTDIKVCLKLRIDFPIPFHEGRVALYRE